MATYLFVLNPVAGRGAGVKSQKRLRSLLDSSKIDYEIVTTARRGHATDLAREASAEVIVAVGGDGTANEIANAIVGTEKVLAILPIGSGNDLIKSLGIPRDMDKAFDIILKGKRKTIDTGAVSCGGPAQRDALGGGTEERVFVNGVGVGLDAAVAERTTHLPRLRGTLLYFVALLQAVWRYKAPFVQMARDSETTESRKLLVAIGNGRCAGGGFYLTPDARVDDGLLDLCVVADLPLYHIFRLVPKVMLAKHRQAKGVTLTTARSISLSTDRGVYVHADGEIVGRQVSQVRIGIRPKSLHVIVGD
jgi:diacylglycerol kinase (ATP)